VFITLGALASAIAAYFGLGLTEQVIVFAVVSVLGIVAARPPLMSYLRRRQTPELLSGAQSMVGKEALVVDAIKSQHEPGHVLVAGENWPAVSEDGEPVPKGTTIRIVGLRQATLVVSTAR
jgi:membrane protein implicated in regulation of membrane protease activity